MGNLQKKYKLFLVCTGLGRVQRGFESYISDLAEKLVNAPERNFNIFLFSGGRYRGNNISSYKLPCLARRSLFSRTIFSESYAFTIEQISFCFFLVPQIVIRKPKCIYLGEYSLYCYLFKIRQMFNLRYSLIFYTGGGCIPGLFNKEKDYVHHVTDYFIESGKLTIPIDRQVLIPHFISVPTINPELVLPNELVVAKNKHKKIVLSIGYLDKQFKRMDFLVKALIPFKDDIFPVLLGEISKETATIENLLLQTFGEGNFFLGKVPRKNIGNFYNIADLFVLASKEEPFGLVFLEALYYRLPVVCSDFSATRFVLKDKANYFNMLNLKELEQLVYDLLFTKNSLVKAETKNFVMKHYSWGSLKMSYINMFNKVLIS